MSSYPKPTEILSIFNPANFPSNEIDSDLSSFFVPKTGGTFSGNVAFNTGLQSNSDINLLGNDLLDVATITNTSNDIITMPSTSGVMALTSDLPDSKDFVDLTSAQNVGGIKTFTDNVNILESNLTFLRPDLSTACLFEYQFDGINISENRGGSTNGIQIGPNSVVITSNTNTINLPTTATTLIGTDTTNTLTNKTLTAPVITSGNLVHSGGALVNFANTNTTLIGEGTANTVTNKTMSSLTNRFHQENYFKYGNSGSQSIPNGGAGATTLTDSVWNGTQATSGTALSYLNGTFTINQNGVYLFTASVYWNDSNAGPRILRLRSSTGQQFDNYSSVSSPATFVSQSVCGVFVLAAGATVVAQCYQETGAARNVSTQVSPTQAVQGVMLFRT